MNSQLPVVATKLIEARASSMRIYVKHDVKDITRTYFEHPIWKAKWSDPVPDMPLDVQLELVNQCNLSCPACPINEMKREKSVLDWNLLRRIVDEAAEEGVCYFTICGIGEASLHPKLFPLLRYIREKRVQPKGLRVLEMLPSVLISNAMWSNKQVDECVENPPDLLSVSLAGLTDKEIVERRAPIDLDRFFHNISRIFNERKVRREVDGAIAPVIHVSTHIFPYEMQDRTDDVEIFLKKWLSISDAVVIKPTMIQGDLTGYGPFLSSNFKKPKEATTLLYPNISKNYFERTAPCFETSRRLSIDSNGDVWCGHHNSEDFGSHLGSAKGKTLRALWHGDKMKRFRDEVRVGVFHRPRCKACGGEIRDLHKSAP